MTRNRRGNGEGTIYKRRADGPWYVRWYDAKGERGKPQCTGTTDRNTATRFLARMVDNVAQHKLGLVDASAEALARQAERPIAEHLADWKLAVQGRGVSPRRLALAMSRAERIIADCAFARLGDIDAHHVRQFLADGKAGGMAPNTLNSYRQAIGQFCRWAWKNQRLATDPLASLEAVKVVGQTYERRELLPDELARLIDTAARGPVVLGMAPADRAMAYRVASGTGFRRAELASLTPASFNLDADPPTVTVAARDSKRRRQDVQPIRPDLATLLGPWMDGKPAGEPVLPLPGHTADMIRADLRRARAWWIREAADRAERRKRQASVFLAYSDDAGRVADFHSLRHTFISRIVASGASVKVCQELARHSTPTLTIGRYAHTRLHDLTEALDALPGTGTPRLERQALRATGTDDATATRTPDSRIVRGDSTGSSRGANRGNRDAMGRNEHDPERVSDDAHRPLKLAGKATGSEGPRWGASKPPAGLEPATCALQKRCGQAETTGKEGYAPATVTVQVAVAPENTPAARLLCGTHPVPHIVAALEALTPADMPDALAIVQALPTLPPAVRAGILAMIRATKGDGR